jgi:hypothetical protein
MKLLLGYPHDHVVAFNGAVTRFADAAYNDGGVTYGPNRVLFLAPQ